LDINAEGIEAWSSGRFRGIWRHWMLIHWRTQKKDNNTIVQPLPPLLHYLCLHQYYSTAMTTLVYLYSEKGFEIVPSQDNNRIRQQIIGDLIKLQTTLFDVLASCNVSFTPLYKGVNTWIFNKTL